MPIWDRSHNSWFYDPWRELDRIRKGFRQLMDIVPGERVVPFPAVNVYGNAEKVRVTAEIPGVDPAKLDVSVRDRTLTLKGERAADSLGAEDQYLRQERGAGAFSRVVQLPFDVDPDKVEARYVDGVLTVEAPMAEAEKPKQITVKPR